MVRSRRLLLEGLGLALSLALVGPPPGSASSPMAHAPRLHALPASLPLHFEANRGQADPAAAFVARGPGYAALLTPAGPVLALAPGPVAPGGAEERARPGVLRLTLEGADPAASAEGLEELPGVVNYAIGNDAGAWRHGVPTYARVRFHGVYPGVDVVYRGSQRQLEFDFEVAPGADPAQIEMSFAPGPAHIDGDGSLVLEVGGRTLVQRAPVAFQDSRGARVPVVARYVRAGGSAVRLELGSYDRDLPLVIDPIVLVYSTFFGGSGNDAASDIAVDPEGNVYLTGRTLSVNFPLANANQATRPQPPSPPQCNVAIYPPPGLFYAMPLCQDSFVTKLTPGGGALVYSTYLGGNSDDRALAITTDAGGNAYVTGITMSDNFPTTETLPDSANGEIFVVKLSPAGALAFSSPVGPNNWGEGTDIEVGPAGKVFLGGWTKSWSLPTGPPGFWKSRNFGSGGMCSVGSPLVHECTLGVVARLDLAAPAIEYITFIGRPRIDDRVYDLAVDGDGNVFAATSERLWKVNPGGTATVYEVVVPARAVAVDADGHAYVTGATRTPDLATTNGAFDTSCGSDGNCNPGSSTGTYDAIAAKVAPDGSSFEYATYLGGAGLDVGVDIEVDAGGHAIITGTTASADFPTTPGALDRSCGSDGTCNGGTVADVFAAKLGAAGQSLVWSTFLGGAAGESAAGVELDAGGSVWVAGGTSSSDFPTQVPFQGAKAGGDDAFVSRLSESGCTFEYWAEVPASAPLGVPVSLAAHYAATGCAGPPAFDWDFGDGGPHAFEQTTGHTYAANGAYPWRLIITLAGETYELSGTILIGCRLTCSASVPIAGQVDADHPFAASVTAEDCYAAPVLAWSFGDGSPGSADASTTHAYAAAGNYPWTLTVTADDQTCSSNGIVRVFQAPTVFAEEFDAPFPTGWTITPATGMAWGPSTHRAYGDSGASAYCGGGGTTPAPPGGPYADNMDTTLVLGPFSLADTSVARAVFAYWTQTEWADYLTFGTSTDGSSFVWGTQLRGDSQGWQLRQLDLASRVGQPNVWFAFLFHSDWGSVEEGVYVDALTIEKLAPACLVACSASAPATAQAQVPVAFTGAATAESCNPSWPSISWDFGDGTPPSTQSSPSHTFALPGTYSWTMTASAGAVSCVRSGTIEIGPPPPCTLTCAAVVPATGFAGIAVELQGSAAPSYCAGAVGYSWVFGDGTPGSDAQSPSHAYGAPGTYPWQMTAAVDDQTCIQSGSITIAPTPPCSLACAASVPAGAAISEVVPFQGSVTPSFCAGQPSVRWAFGDGSPVATELGPAHAFASQGTYGWTFLATVDDVACVRTGEIAVAARNSQVVLGEGFEGGFPGSWAVTPLAGTQWGPTTFRASEGAKSAYCAGGGAPVPAPGGNYFANMSTGLTYGPFSLEGATAAALTFDYWSNTEQGFDFFSWGVSIDNQQFYGATTSGNGYGWQTGALDLGAVAAIDVLGQPQVWLRFFFTSDFSVQREGVYVDDVRLEKTLPVAAGCAVDCTVTPPASALVGVPAAFQTAATLTGCSEPAAFSWDFGDGTAPSTQQNPTHVYSSAGLHLWQATATADGSAYGESGVLNAVMPPTAPVRRHLRR